LTFGPAGYIRLLINSYMEVCHPHCVCENWKRYLVKHSCVN